MPVILPMTQKSQAGSKDELEFRRSPPEVMTAEEAALYLGGISLPTLEAAIKEQGLPCKVIGKRIRLFSRYLLDEWVQGEADA